MSGFGGGGSGFEAEAGGGNPTGYSESGGTVTIADELNVGTAADAVATGDFAAGLTGDRRMFYDQSVGSLSLLSASGTFTHSLTAGGNELTVNGASSIGFQSAGAYRMSLNSSGLLCSTAGALPIGTTSNPFGSLTLGDATAQVLLDHDGATDGLLRVSDPNGVAGGRIDLLDAAGNADVYLYESTGYAILGGVNGVAIAPNNTTKLLVGNTVVQPGYAVGTVDLGAAAYPFANLHVAGTPQAAALQIKSASQELTALSGASASTTNLVPAGCTILYVVARVTTLITGATTFDVGDGTDVDRYGAAIALAAGTTVDETDGTADPRSWSASAQDVTLTANGSNFTAGAVRITAFYLDPTAPTS